MLDLLTDLADKSLVMVDALGGRYGFLETVRQYAQERLMQSGEGDATRSRHVSYYVEFAEMLAPELLGARQTAGIERLDVERENVLSAHKWCLSNAGHAEQDCRLVHAIKHYWFIRGMLNLGHRITVEAVTTHGGQAAGIARCKALWAAGQICNFTGRYAEAQHYLQESLSMARILHDPLMQGRVLNNLSQAALGQGDWTTARHHGEEALVLVRTSGDKRGIASASNALAQVHRLNGDLESAEPLYLTCVEQSRQLGDSEGVSVGLLNLAMLAIARGTTERASSMLLEVLAIVAKTGSKKTGQSALEVSAGLAAVRGEWERAARLYGAAETQTRITGAQIDSADEAFLRPLIAATRDALGDQRFGAAEASGLALPLEEALASARAWLSTT